MSKHIKIPDQYDDAIAYLTEHEDEITLAWQHGPICREARARRGACLFADAGPLDLTGCLTQVRSGESVAATPELTAAIRADDRLPLHPEQIRLEHLPVFAEWQRRLTRELGEDRSGS